MPRPKRLPPWPAPTRPTPVRGRRAPVILRRRRLMRGPARGTRLRAGRARPGPDRARAAAPPTHTLGSAPTGPGASAYTCDLADDVDLTATAALATRRRDVDREDLAQSTGHHIAIQICHRQPPVGPNRSVLILLESTPPVTSTSATDSTNPVGPQTNTASADAPPTGASSCCASTRPIRPDQPAGPSRVYTSSSSSPELSAGQPQQLIAVHHGCRRADGVDEPEGRPAPRPLPRAQHRHDRHDAAAAGGEQRAGRILRPPDEPAADRPAQLDLVADREHLHEVRRHLTVVDELDGQVDHAGTVRVPVRGDRVRALGGVAVGCGQPHIHMLAGQVAGPVRQLERDGA